MKTQSPSHSAPYLVIMIIVSAILCLSVGPAYSADPPVARLTEFSGKVLIKSKGSWAVKPEKGLPLFSLDRVVTRNGRAVLTFDDGAIMEMKSNSNLLIEEKEEEKGLAKTVTTAKRKLRLFLGKLLFKTGAGRYKKNTVFETPTAVCGLRGTAGILSIGADGQTYIQFTDGGAAYTLGDLISGVAQDVPAEIADLNPAQRAAFVAAAATDNASRAAEKAASGEISQADADLALAIAEEAAALELKTQAESMLDNPDPTIQTQAQDVIDAAQAAIDAAKNAQQQAIDQGAAPAPSGLPTGGEPGTEPTGFFDVPPLEEVEDLLPVLPQEPIVGDGQPLPPPPSIPVPPPPEETVNFSVRFPDFPGEGDSALLAGFFNLDNTGTMLFSGTGLLPPNPGEPWGTDFNAPAGDGSVLDGYLVGLTTGSWEALLTGIYVGGGTAGYVTGAMTGVNSEDGFGGAGPVSRVAMGPTTVTPEGLALALAEQNPFTGRGAVAVPDFSWMTIVGGAPVDSGQGALPDAIQGISLTDGRIIGAWEGAATGGMYDNPTHTPAQGKFGYMYGETYYLGDINLADDGLAHVNISGDFELLGPAHWGTLRAASRWVYDGQGFNGIEAGNVTLVPLALKGGVDAALKYFDGAGLSSGGSINGLAGGLVPGLWTGAPTQTRFMGEFDQTPAGPMLLYGWGPFFEGGSLVDDGRFGGYMVGIWRDGALNARARLLYIDPAQTAGYLAGSVAGNAYEDAYDGYSGLWKATGNLAAGAVGPTTVVPLDLTLAVSTSIDDFSGDGGSGAFFDTLDQPSGFIRVADAEGESLRIIDQGWGIWKAAAGGTYGGPVTGLWEIYTGGDYDAVGRWVGKIEGTGWGSADFSGTFEGMALTETFFYEFDGDAMGTLVGPDKWQAVGIGTFASRELDISAAWGGDSLYYNSSGNASWVGSEYGPAGLLSRPDGGYDFVAIGEYSLLGYGGGGYLWNTAVLGTNPGVDEILEGITAGIWNNDYIFTGGPWTEAGMDGSLYAIYSDGETAHILSGRVRGEFDPNDPAVPENGNWFVESEGILQKSAPMPLPGPGATVVWNPLYARLHGGFTDQDPTGIFNDDKFGYTLSLEALDGTPATWGLYNVLLGYGGSYNGRPLDAQEEPVDAAWWADLGGYGTAGDDTMYWLAHIENGTWSARGEIRGDLAGEYLSDEQMGTIQGPVYGVNQGADSGTWIGQSVGTFTGQPLTFGGYIDSALVYYEDAPPDLPDMIPATYLFGLLGSTATTLFTGTPTPVRLMGGFDPYVAGSVEPFLIHDGGSYFLGDSADNRGLFQGKMVGLWAGGHLEAMVRALYIYDQDGDGTGPFVAGYLKEDPSDPITGTFRPDLDNLWEASGRLTAVQAATTTDVPPGDLGVSLIYDQFVRTIRSVGTLGDGTLDVNWGAGTPVRISGQGWGIWDAAFGGAYGFGTQSGGWLLYTGGEYWADGGYGGHWIGHLDGTTWGERIAGSFTATALTEEAVYDLTGTLLGTTRNGTPIEGGGEEGDWQAAGLGTYTRQPLDAGGAWGLPGEVPSPPPLGSLYANAFNYLMDVGDDVGLIGLVKQPEDGNYGFLSMGQYTEFGNVMGYGGAYLWNTPVYGTALSEDGVNFEGYTAGIWNDGSFTGGVWNTANMDGSVVALQWTSATDADILQNGVSGTYHHMTGDPESEPTAGYFEVRGTLTPETMLQQPSSLQINTGPMSAWLFGSFNGSQGIIRGLSHFTSETKYFDFDLADPDTRPWGIYDLKLQGYGGYGGYSFEQKPTGDAEWTANLNFGSADFGLSSDFAVTLANNNILTGTWSAEGEIRGDVVGFFSYDGSQVGQYKGPFFGVATADVSDGYWIGESIGTWQWTNGIGYYQGVSLFEYAGGALTKVGEDPADVALTLREDGKIDLLAIGDYRTDEGAGETLLQSTKVAGFVDDEAGTGTFEGFAAAVWKDRAIEGSVAAVRTTSDGGAGLLTGEVAGAYYPGLEKWKVESTLEYEPLVAGLDPDKIEIRETEIALTGSGSFATGNEIAVAVSEGRIAGISNQDWGVWRTLEGGTFTGTPSDSWALGLTAETPDTRQWVNVSGFKWSDKKIGASTTGAWVNWNEAVTGVMGGGLKGTFDPAVATWQAVSAGTRMDTTRFMDMVAEGRNAALEKLNIPCIEVGKATLTGKSDLLDVSMRDVTFFAYRTGASPKIWATKDVGGVYRGIPTPGHTVGLSGGGLNASFKVNNWSNAKWGAGVAGSGTIQRSDVGGSIGVNFKGAAAGTYGNGQFSGTGAGVASPR